MNFGKWQMRIEKIYWNAMCPNRIYLFQGEGRDRVFLTQDGVLKRIEEGVVIKNEDIYFADLPDEALSAIATGLADQGIKTQNDHKNEGLLQATNKHLEDMRTLVFKGAKK